MAARRVLEPYLAKQEIAAILHRRELLLTLIAEKIAREGEEAVLFSYRHAGESVGQDSEPMESSAPPPP